jgi:hypothetical protein
LADLNGGASTESTAQTTIEFPDHGTTKSERCDTLCFRRVYCFATAAPRTEEEAQREAASSPRYGNGATNSTATATELAPVALASSDGLDALDLPDALEPAPEWVTIPVRFAFLTIPYEPQRQKTRSPIRVVVS